MTLATEPENLEPTNVPGLPKPTDQVVNPSSLKIDEVYKNIESEPLINKIKRLEVQLSGILGIESMEVDMSQQKISADKFSTEDDKNAAIKKLYRDILDCFNDLLKTPYGSLGYLVKSDSESIVKLYGVDSDDDYYLKLRGSVIRVSSKRLERMVVAGGGRRFIGERGLTIHDPAETTGNMKVADHVIHEIIYAIHEKLEELTD